MIVRTGSILGYDLNEKHCQISYYDETKDEPETLNCLLVFSRCAMDKKFF